MERKVWVVFYYSTDEDFGYSFDGAYVFHNETAAKETAIKIWDLYDYVTVKECAILDKMPSYIKD